MLEFPSWISLALSTEVSNFEREMNFRRMFNFDLATDAVTGIGTKD